MAMVAIMATDGDMNVFAGDMNLVDDDYLCVCDVITEDPEKRAFYGEKYLHFGDW